MKLKDALEKEKLKRHDAEQKIKDMNEEMKK